jgi:septum formation protein
MLYLASQSPRRQSILNDLKVHFELLLASDDEDAEALESVHDKESSIDYVQRVTLAKLGAACSRLERRHLPWHPILCADTTVAIHDSSIETILGKPQGPEDAVEMLTRLSGKVHVVHTAVAIQVNLQTPPTLRLSSSEVFFTPLSNASIQAYIQTGEPMGKAGAYGIQGIGSCFIEKIHGSYSGIMGLPIFETCQLLDIASIPYILST